MGLTIHYALKLTSGDANAARRVVARMRERAKALPFREVGDVVELTGEDCDHRRVEDDEALQWLLVQSGQILMRGEYIHQVLPRHVIAFHTSPGEECEPANFGLSRYPSSIRVKTSADPSDSTQLPTGLTGWSWTSFCKTQYASNPAVGGLENFLRCHLSVIAMLDYCAKLGVLEKVNDEGGYWTKRDPRLLTEQVGAWNRSLAAFYGHLKDVTGLTTIAPISEYPDFEHLEAEGRKTDSHEDDDPDATDIR